MHHRLGIGIISFRRASNLRRLLASLEAQTELLNVDFHLFQDGATNRFSGRQAATQREIDASVRAFERSNLPNKEAHIQVHNVGIAINQFEAAEYLAQHYGHIAIIENDVVLSPYWLRLVRVLFDQTVSRDDIFSFSLGFKQTCGRERIVDNLDVTTYVNTIQKRPTGQYDILPRPKQDRPDNHWWAECWTAEKWQRIRPYFLEYYELVKDCDYIKRDHDTIREYQRSKGWEHYATSQDGGKQMAVWRAGMERICTVVNRGISTGWSGTHFSSGAFVAGGLAYQTPYIHPQDAEIEEFKLP